MLGQFFTGPRLRGLGKPWLTGTGERKPPAVAEHAQVPDLPSLFRGGSVSARRTWQTSGQQRPDRFAGHELDWTCCDRWCPLAPQRVTDRPQDAEQKSRSPSVAAVLAG